MAGIHVPGVHVKGVMIRTFSILLILLLPVALQAQTRSEPISQLPASARHLIAIKVIGSKRFPEAEIAAETGLQIGTPVNEDDFKKASRRLGDTGAFTDVAYSFSYSSAGTKLEFHVTDADKFVPVHFDDFVWFSDEELRKRIKDHVPMFDGELPIFGRMADEVSDVLQALLVEGSIPGHVGYVKAGKTDGPIESIDYSVSDDLIRVRKIEFTGVSDEEHAALASVAAKLSQTEYSRSRLNLFVQKQVLPVFYSQGYLKAVCGPPQPMVAKQTTGESSEADVGPRNQTIVDVTFALTPGQQYKLKAIEWSGNRQFATEILAKMVRANFGQPADTVRLADDLKSVQKLYGSRGFITAGIKADAAFDDDTGEVTVRLIVTEGEIYHMGDLEFRGLDNSLTAKLRGAWKIRPGEVYDVTYLDEYLPEAKKLLPSRLDWDVAPHVTANGGDKTVDVDLIYSVKAPN